MKIVVNDTAASTTGALSILKEFYTYIRDNDTENDWIFLLSDNYVESTDRIKVIVVDETKKSWKDRLLFDLFKGHKYLESLNADVVISLQNTITFGYRGKQLTYVHQPLGYQNTKKFSFLKKEEREYAVYQYGIGRLIDKSVKKASHVIVQTKWMKEAVIEKTHISRNKITNILPQVADLSEYRTHRAPEGGRFFYPSGDILYKNHALIFRAAGLLIEEGIKDFRITLTLTRDEFLAIIAKETDTTDSVTRDEIISHFDFRGRMKRERVFEEYAASTLLFPSYIETFGYPPAEARRIGTIVISADTPFSREVLEGYRNAYFHPPFDAKALKELMKKTINSELEYHDLGEETNNETENDNSWAKVISIITDSYFE